MTDLLEIVDSHHHLWNLDPVDPGIGYKWLRAKGIRRPFGDPAPIQRDYLIDELLAEPTSARIVGSVHIQCEGQLEQPVDETRWLQSVADGAGMPNAIIGLVDLSKDGAEDVLASHAQFANFRGIRQIIGRLNDRPNLSFAPEHFLRNPLWREQFALLEKFGMSFDLQLYPDQMVETAGFLADHPNIPVVIDHAGSPYDQSVEGLRTWREGLAALAALPQICMKLSGFGMYDANWTADSIRPIYETIIELFGSNRSMFGSNYPVDKLMTPYDSILGHLFVLTENLSVSDREAIFANSARRFYRI